MDQRNNNQDRSANDIALKRIAQALDELDYGTVQVTVHNSRVVQIDKIERIRMLREEAEHNGSGI